MLPLELVFHYFYFAVAGDRMLENSESEDIEDGNCLVIVGYTLDVAAVRTLFCCATAELIKFMLRESVPVSSRWYFALSKFENRGYANAASVVLTIVRCIQVKMN